MCNLNMVERVVLVKSAIDCLPTYWFNMFYIPVEIFQKLESIYRIFLWGEFKDKGSQVHKIHMLQWNKVILSKNERGFNLTP